MSQPSSFKLSLLAVAVGIGLQAHSLVAVAASSTGTNNDVYVNSSKIVIGKAPTKPKPAASGTGSQPAASATSDPIKSEIDKTYEQQNRAGNNGVVIGNKSRVQAESSFDRASKTGKAQLAFQPTTIIGNESEAGGSSIVIGNRVKSALPDNAIGNYIDKDASYPSKLQGTIEVTQGKDKKQIEQMYDNSFGSRNILIGNYTVLHPDTAGYGSDNIAVGKSTLFGRSNTTLGLDTMAARTGVAIGTSARTTLSLGDLQGNNLDKFISSLDKKIADLDLSPTISKSDRNYFTKKWMQLKNAALEIKNLPNNAYQEKKHKQLNLIALAAESAAIAIGENTLALGSEAVALGRYAKAPESNATALGSRTKANNYATAVGYSANALAKSSIAIGQEVQVEQGSDDSYALGRRAYITNSRNAIAIGSRAKVMDKPSNVSLQNLSATRRPISGEENTSYVFFLLNNANLVGREIYEPTADGKKNGGKNLFYAHQNSAAIGTDSRSYGFNAWAIGTGSQAFDSNTFALGRGAIASGDSAFSAGDTAITRGEAATAVGYSAQALSKKSVSVGANAVVVEENESGVALGADSVSERFANQIGYDPATNRLKTRNEIPGFNAQQEATLRAEIAQLQSDYDAKVQEYYAHTKDYAGTLKMKAMENDIVTLKNSLESKTDERNRMLATWEGTAGALSVGNAKKGISRQITGVAAGSEDTDAVNVAQLKRVRQDTNAQFARIDSRFDKLDLRVNRATAAAAAVGSLKPMEYHPNQTLSAAVGVANYRNATAIAASAFWRPSPNVMLNLGLSKSGKEVVYNGGLSFYLGKTPTQGQKGEMQAENLQLRSEVATLKQEMAEMRQQLKQLMKQ